MTRRRPREPQPGVPARYPGICAVCHNEVTPRQRIVFRRGDPVHVACHSGYSDE